MTDEIESKSPVKVNGYIQNGNSNGHSNGMEQGNNFCKLIYYLHNYESKSYAFELIIDNYSDTLTLLKGSRLYWNQFKALLEKKVLNSWRNMVLLLIQILIPISFVSITIIIVRSWGGNKDLPKLQLSIDTYQPTHTTVQFDPTSWADSIENRIFENYRELFRNKSKDKVALEVISSDMINHYLNKSKEFLARVNNRYLFGAAIEKTNITVRLYQKFPFIFFSY